MKAQRQPGKCSWKCRNASEEGARERERERLRGKREMVLWRRVNTKLVWVACQACKRNITLTPTLAQRIPHGISMSAKLWQSLSNQGPVALNYWAVTSNNNSCISKAHEIIGDIKTLWFAARSGRCIKWKMANRRRPVLIWGPELSQIEVATENCLNLKRTADEW